LAGVLGVYAAIHLYFGIRFETWGYMTVRSAHCKEIFMLIIQGMVMGLLLGVLGYFNRVPMQFNPFPKMPFIMCMLQFL
jgi:hypothetical protein